MGRMPVRLKDVAQHAGVSVKTVSNVVNDHPNVSAAMRERVQASLTQLGYRPNLAARQLKHGRGGFIALAVPQLDSPYFAELAARLSDEATRRGFLLLLDITGADPDQERLVLSGMRSHMVDGVVFSPLALSAEEIAARTDDIPLVLLGERRTPTQFDHVAVDSVAASRAMGEHFRQQGRHRWAVIGRQTREGTASVRLEGFAEAAHDAGVELPDERIVTVDGFGRDEGYRGMRRLLDLPDDRRPDAVPPPETGGVDDEGHPAGPRLAQSREGAGVVVAERSADVDEQAAGRGERLGVVEDAAHDVGPLEPDPGEGVERPLDRVVVPHAPVAGGVGGHEVHGVRRPVEVGQDRGGGRHRPLQGPGPAAPAVPDLAGVDEDDGPALRGPVLLAHHEVTGAGRRGPVDAAQVVAVAVLADRLVVLAVEGDHVRDRPLAADAAAERPPGLERDDPGEDDDLAVAGERGAAQGEAERVAHPQPQRTEPVHSAGVRADGVADLGARPGAQRAEDEPRAVAERVVERLLGEEHRRGGGLDVTDPHGDGRPLVDGDPGGDDAALDDEGQPVPPGEDERDRDEREEQHPGPGHVGLAEEDAGGDEDQAAAREGRASGREDPSEPAHRRLSGWARGRGPAGGGR